MTDIEIIPVQRLDFHVSRVPWAFAADRRTQIEDYFTHLRRGKPELWNGRVLVLRDFEMTNATLQGTMFETDYASFIAWRDWGFPDRDVRACFAMGALLSLDVSFFLCSIYVDPARAACVCSPACPPAPRDACGGRLYFDRKVRGEIPEQTRLSLDGLPSAPCFLFLIGRPHP